MLDRTDEHIGLIAELARLAFATLPEAEAREELRKALVQFAETQRMVGALRAAAGEEA